MKQRIICVGNRLSPEDDTGARVCARLLQLALPPDVGVIDGGLGGLDLLRFVEGAERAVFVDRVEGFGQPGEVLVLDASEAARAVAPRYNHAAGLAYLLNALPHVCDGAIPEVFVVGVEGCASEETIMEAAHVSLEVAAGNHVSHISTGPADFGG